MKHISKFLGLFLGIGVGVLIVYNLFITLYKSDVNINKDLLVFFAANERNNYNIITDSRVMIDSNNYSYIDENHNNISLRNKELIAKGEVFQNKVESVEKIYKKYNSPMISNAKTIVKSSELNNIDYKMLTAISIVESGGGKICFKSYNAFGWGSKSFSSFDEGIQTVAEGLKNGYYNKGLDSVEEIAPVYNYVNPIDWSSKVNKIISEFN